MTMITNVRLLHPDAAASPDSVDIDFGATILSVRPAGTGPAVVDSADGTGRFLVPGLIDTHVHLGSRAALDSSVRAGVTTLIDLGTYPETLVQEQRAVRAAPAIISAGSAASAPGSIQITRMGFPADSGVSGPRDAERYLAWRGEHGSDLIKIIIEDPAATDVPALDMSTLTAIVDGAHRHGLSTVAHVVTAAAFVRGLDAGVDILTHAPLDRPLPEETVQRMYEAGTVSSPTLIMMRTMARARLGERADAAFGNAVESVRRMHAAGVQIVTGTDANETPMAPVRHGAALHEEFALLRSTGMTVDQVVEAATSGAAAAFRLADRGRVSEGLRGDLLLISADPMENLSVLAQPEAVWIGGERVV